MRLLRSAARLRLWEKPTVPSPPGAVVAAEAGEQEARGQVRQRHRQGDREDQRHGAERPGAVA